MLWNLWNNDKLDIKDFDNISLDDAEAANEVLLAYAEAAHLSELDRKHK